MHIERVAKPLLVSFYKNIVLLRREKSKELNDERVIIEGIMLRSIKSSLVVWEKKSNEQDHLTV